MLLAKRQRPGAAPVTLEEHSLDTERAAMRMFGPERPAGRAWSRFFRLDANSGARFLPHLRAAALFHDIGKANEDFARAVGQGGFFKQMVRHEHLSALILCLPAVRAWLKRSPIGFDLDVLTATVLSHHLKAGETDDRGHRWCQPSRDGSLRLFLDHPEVQAILRRVAEVASLAPEAIALPREPWSDHPPWFDAWQRGTSTIAANLCDDVRGDNANRERRAFLLALKAGLIISDSLSSGLVREGHSIDEWIDEIAHRTPLTEEEIRERIIAPRVKEIETRAQRRFVFQRFQDDAARLPDRALVLAGCGAGKTLAAWRWAETRARDRELHSVVFLYPTRGTATEGFRDYVAWAPEAEAALVHGTSKYELEGMSDNPSEASVGKDFSLSEAQARLFSLGLWSRRYFSATVDQFLGFLEHVYGSMCLLPLLARSCVVLDEVHSYDPQMFRAVLSFLENFDVPVLAMTATLPESRRRALEQVGLTVYPTAQERESLADLRQEEERPRYRLEPVNGEPEGRVKAIDAYRAGRRVLWVVNQVRRCQELAEALEAELGTEVLCYHSRFRLMDRQRVHADTVSAFKRGRGPVVALTTQVCEMSLDLDADVLITEHAKVTALVQRFGRANRDRANPREHRAVLHTYAPENSLPYEGTELREAQTMLAALVGRDISQHDLALELLKNASESRLAPSCSFIEAGFYAEPGNLREEGPPTESAVLDRDVEEVELRLRSREPYDGFVVPVAKKAVVEHTVSSRWPKYLKVVRAARYTQRFGFSAEEV